MAWLVGCRKVAVKDAWALAARLMGNVSVTGVRKVRVPPTTVLPHRAENWMLPVAVAKPTFHRVMEITTLEPERVTVGAVAAGKTTYATS